MALLIMAQYKHFSSDTQEQLIMEGREKTTIPWPTKNDRNRSNYDNVTK